MLSVALAAIARGETVIPLCWPDKTGHCGCGQHHEASGAGKVPLIKAWQKNGTQTQDGAKEYWRRYPLANVGIVIQPGHFVLDVDADHGGLESLARIQEDHGQLPLTYKVKTGGGGYHYYFIGDGIRNTAAMAGYPGLDIRGAGGYVVGPGSRHKSGKLYEIAYDIEQAPAPTWLVELANKRPQRPAGTSTNGQRIPNHQRNDTLTRMAGRLVHDGLTGEPLDAAIRKINETQCDPPLTDHELTMLKSAKTWPAGDLPAPTKADIRPKSYTTKEILSLDLKPLTWLIEGMVIDEGLAFLAGRKKLGKSRLALQIAAAVSTGGEILDRACKQGSVLVYVLEDGERRLKEHLQQMQISPEAPIEFILGIKPLDQGGADELEAKIVESKPALVIIDTLAKAKSGKIDENDAGQMGDLVNHLHDLSLQYHLAIIVIAHHGKSSYGDPGMDIRGSSATPGATDANLGMYKKDGVYYLTGEGRDFSEFDLKIELDIDDRWQWKLVGDTRKLAAEEAEQAILDALDTLGEADAGAIAKAAGKTRTPILRVCNRMKQDGRLEAKTTTQGKQKKIVYFVKKQGIGETPES